MDLQKMFLINCGTVLQLQQGYTNRVLATRLQDLIDKWMQGCNIIKEIQD